MHGQVSTRRRPRAAASAHSARDEPWIDVAPATAEDDAPAGIGDSPILAYLGRVLERHRPNRAGTVAGYIPELARADPASFGIAIATVDGVVYEAGDTRTPFTIQSMSKPLTYAATLDLNGEAAVRRRIGVEPTGEAFNAITLESGAGTPLNPMVNAGAIAAVGHDPGRGDRTHAPSGLPQSAAGSLGDR